MKKKIKIALGTTSQHKLSAVLDACASLGLDVDVVGYKVSSRINEQPVGVGEGVEGSYNRAQEAYSQSGGESYCVGIESVIVFDLDGKSFVFDIAFIVIIAPGGEIVAKATTPGVMFPDDAFRVAKKRGFDTTTVGSVIAEQCGGNGTDPHAILTEGRVTRTETLVAGLIIALKQIDFEI